MKDWYGYYYLVYGKCDASETMDVDFKITDDQYYGLMESLKNNDDSYLDICDEIANDFDIAEYESDVPYEDDEYDEEDYDEDEDDSLYHGGEVHVEVMDPFEISLSYIDKDYLKYREDSDEYEEPEYEEDDNE